jgi:hypothetical protein
MVVLDKKIIIGIFACCLVTCIEADSDPKENSDVQGNYWGFRMNKQGDGPMEVETESSSYNKDGIVQSKKESGYLEFDKFGRAYIRKVNGTVGAVAPNQPLQPIPVPQVEQAEQTENGKRHEISHMCPCPGHHLGHHFNRKCSDISGDRQSLAREIKQELLEVSELIEQETAHPNNEIDQDEIYHFLKKKLRKIKKMAKFLLTNEESHPKKKKRWIDFMKI